MDAKADEIRPEEPPDGPDLILEDEGSRNILVHLPWEFRWFRNSFFSELRSENKVEGKSLHGDT